MGQGILARIGFVTPTSPSSPHFAGFKALVPSDVQLDFEGLGLVRTSLEELRGVLETVVERTKKAVKEREWQGVIVSGAPVELLNPGLLKELRNAVKVPVTTALDSCATALRAFSASRVLLLTPFDESMNRLVRDYLVGCGIEAVSPVKTFKHYSDALKLAPEEVYAYTKDSFEAVKNVKAIYFQGAVLDPLKVLQKIEDDLRVPVVASNPAMLWFILSKLGQSYSIGGNGKLLREWNKLPQ